MKPYPGGIRHDFRDPWLNARLRSRGRRWAWFALGILPPLVAGTALLVSGSNPSNLPAGESPAPQEAIPDAAVAPPASLPQAAAPSFIGPELPQAGPREFADAATIDLLVDRGDTLEILFRRNGLKLADLAEMAVLPDAAEHLRVLKPGNEIRVTHRDGSVLELVREIDAIELLEIRRSEGGFEAVTTERDFETRTVDAHGEIRTSLFEASLAAGVSDALTMEMAGIFQWDIDFIMDVRSGDTFTLIYEELWRDGEKLGNGEIVAVQFVNQGTQYRAARYTDAAGNSDYFTPEGLSVRKAFMRAPLEFTRVSSNFNPNRRHPVLNTIRAHRGVDYAAPTGTPVMAAGDGTIEMRGRNGGYGNTVVLRHGGNITTLYAHLSRFGAPTVGSRVRQGDIIGYVGSTGLATGPHLHYEYRISGVHRNPRTVPLPPADPISAQHREDFEATATALWRRLDQNGPTAFANASN